MNYNFYENSHGEDQVSIAINLDMLKEKEQERFERSEAKEVL